ncbi:glycine oxidase ThiO [soil metagenome]
MPPPTQHVVVVGAGAIGLATAFRLAEAGAEVVLIDASGTRGASWAAAGMLAPVSEASFGEEELTRLTLAAVPAFIDFATLLQGLTGRPVGLRTEGTLAVALTADDRAALLRLAEFRTSLGLATDNLTGSEARLLEPYPASDVRAGALAGDDLSVDNRGYLLALDRACSLAGVTRLTGEVTSLSRSGDRVDGVLTAAGQVIAADLVVLCAGALTERLTGYPIQPVKGQILRLQIPDRLTAAGPVLTRTVRGLVHGSEVYLLPRVGGEVVVGATVEQQGFDTTVTAGGVYELLRNAYELLPISSEFTFVEALAGLRPGTADNGPLLGQVQPGLILATGHYRNGILLSALTALAVRRLAAGERPAEEWDAFDPDRFTRSVPSPT